MVLTDSKSSGCHYFASYNRDGFTGGGGGSHPLALARESAEEGAIFRDLKAKK
jgi:hypothetical protein